MDVSAKIKTLATEAQPLAERMPPHKQEYVQRLAVKKGMARMDRHPATGLSGAPKKAGHGGKFTWDGPVDPRKDLEPVPPALDENDPNYADDYEDADAEDYSEDAQLENPMEDEHANSKKEEMIDSHMENELQNPTKGQ